MRVAILVGISGKTGKALMEGLIKSRHYKKVIILTRRENRRLKNLHLKKVIVDFSRIEDYSQEFEEADDVFCLLGTDYISTYKLDDAAMFEYEYPVKLAHAAKNNGVKNFFLLNPTRADLKSTKDKMKVRAKLAEEIQQMGFDNFCLFKVNAIAEPVDTDSSMFAARKGLGTIINMVGMGLIDKLRPTPANLVANKMIAVAISNPLEKKEFLPQDY
ncbi:MAG: NAD(P)H-binding protein [Bacteroidia bacterium]|nr:NAD(P)H-binding protein [Bacteroidia bacterium]